MFGIISTAFWKHIVLLMSQLVSEATANHKDAYLRNSQLLLMMVSINKITTGPRLFLSCPMDVEGSRVWFTDLWNYSIIPYMLEAVREGLQVRASSIMCCICCSARMLKQANEHFYTVMQMYGRKAAWEDPAKWVMESFPWVASPQQHEWHSLLRLRPEDVGFDGYNISQEGSPGKQPAQGKSEEDPLVSFICVYSL